MNAIELIRNADGAGEILTALGTYLGSLQDVPWIPAWCLALPIQGEGDIARRMVALFAVVNATSRNLLYRECRVAKSALHVLSAAAQQLRHAKGS